MSVLQLQKRLADALWQDFAECQKAALTFQEEVGAWVLRLQSHDKHFDVPAETTNFTKDEDPVPYISFLLEEDLPFGGFANSELRITFSDGAVRDKLWNQLQTLQGRVYHSQGRGDPLADSLQLMHGLATSGPAGEKTTTILPGTAKLESLPTLQDIFELKTTFTKEDVLVWVVDTSIVHSIVALFQALDPESAPRTTPTLIFNILHAALLLNNKELICTLISDRCFLSFCAICEFNPSLTCKRPANFCSGAQKARFQSETFRQILPDDVALQDKIVQNHRLHYLMDTVLALSLPPGTQSTLIEIIASNNFDILDALLGLSQPNDNPPIYRVLERSLQEGSGVFYRFLRELLAISKVSVSHGVTVNSMKRLWQTGLPVSLVHGLQSRDPATRSTCFQWLLSCIDTIPAVVREFVVLFASPTLSPTRKEQTVVDDGSPSSAFFRLQHKSGIGPPCLLSALIAALTGQEEADPSAAQTVLEALLTTSASTGTAGSKTDLTLLDFFFLHSAGEVGCMARILATACQTLLHAVGSVAVLDFLVFCTATHPARTAEHLSPSELLPCAARCLASAATKVRGLSAREKALALGVLRLLRACILAKNQALLQRVSNAACVQAVAAVLAATLRRKHGNMLEAASLAFFDAIGCDRESPLISTAAEYICCEPLAGRLPAGFVRRFAPTALGPESPTLEILATEDVPGITAKRRPGSASHKGRQGQVAGSRVWDEDETTVVRNVVPEAWPESIVASHGVEPSPTRCVKCRQLRFEKNSEILKLKKRHRQEITNMKSEHLQQVQALQLQIQSLQRIVANAND